MKIYKTQEEVEADIYNRVLAIVGDVTFECPISIEASIVVTDGDIIALNINCWNINCRNIKCWAIKCWDINCWNIKCWDIKARDINAWGIIALDIDCLNINCWNIKALDINCRNLHCWDIKTGDILYYAFCSVYKNIKCKSIRAKRTPAQMPVCLDGKLQIVDYKKVG